MWRYEFRCSDCFRKSALALARRGFFVLPAAAESRGSGTSGFGRDQTSPQAGQYRGGPSGCLAGFRKRFDEAPDRLVRDDGLVVYLARVEPARVYQPVQGSMRDTEDRLSFTRAIERPMYAFAAEAA